MNYQSVISIIVFLKIGFCFAFEPITTAGAVGALFLSAGSIFNAWLGNEYCSDKWISLDIDNLQSDIEANVFGQHLMQNIVLQTLKVHVKQDPKKALVLSFHGSTGTGKNLVSSYIAKNLFKEGSKSRYVHLYIGSKDFPHSELKTQYMEKLKSDVEKATSQCERNLFIFDEVDKMAPGVLDALSPYIDFYENLRGVDYRKNIFIFLSNSGSNGITKIALKNLEAGKKRDDITLKDIEQEVSRGAYHEIGGLQNSEIVKRNRIDVYVPFLPLEKEHIKQCIYVELRELKWMASQDLVNKIAEEIEYIPKNTNVFSKTGCRLVHPKVRLYADEFQYN